MPAVHLLYEPQTCKAQAARAPGAKASDAGSEPAVASSQLPMTELVEVPLVCHLASDEVASSTGPTASATRTPQLVPTESPDPPPEISLPSGCQETLELVVHEPKQSPSLDAVGVLCGPSCWSGDSRSAFPVFWQAGAGASAFQAMWQRWVRLWGHLASAGAGPRSSFPLPLPAQVSFPVSEAPVTKVYEGTLKRFSARHGYGFISSAAVKALYSRDAFVDGALLPANVQPGDKFLFELTLSEKQHPKVLRLWGPPRALRHLPEKHGLVEVSPADVRFTHDSISPFFSCGRRLVDTYDELVSGRTSMAQIPLMEIAVSHGKLWTRTGNRRLWVFRKLYEGGFIETVWVKISSEEIAAWKFTTQNDGEAVRVRDAHALHPWSSPIRRLTVVGSCFKASKGDVQACVAALD